MEFFDLNVPYHEKDALATGDTDNAAKKAGRLKKVVKVMELGYTGVAYDRLFKGVMSDRDRCSIAPFPVSSLLKAAPTLAESVKFHRQLVGVPNSATFRQYRRMTVVLDSVVGASVLNSGNPVLKSYDLVAVRPTNQVAFEQACKAAEVDLISIDFSQKLSFRLKFPFVKAAIERGIYFEISYSQLVSSAQFRREMLPNAKMLVSWTRGKNLIISSAAATANELRGPFDVVNLFSLLGISTERAKAAISRNCRSLLAGALRKKQCHKEAIRLESISPGELKASGDLLRSWNNWDPISSGDGDLPSLDDFANLFTNVTNESQKVTGHNFSTEYVICENKTFERKNCNDENISSQNIQSSLSQDAMVLKADSPMRQSQNLDGSCFSLASEALPFPSRPLSYSKGNLLPISKLSTLPSSAVEPDTVGMGQDQLLASKTCTMVCEVDLQPKYCMSSEDDINRNPVASGFPAEKESKPSLHPNEPKISDEGNFLPGFAVSSVGGGLSGLHTCIDEDRDKCLLVQSSSLEVLNGSSMDVDLTYVHSKDAMFSTEHDMDFKSSDDQAVIPPKVLHQEDLTLHTCSVSVQDCHVEDSLNEEQDDAIRITKFMSVKGNNDKSEAHENLFLVTTDTQMLGRLNVEGQKKGCGASESLLEDKHKSGKCRFIQKRKKKFSLFAHKGLLKPFLFKKKGRRLKGSRKREWC